MKTLSINLTNKNYTIFIKRDIFNEIGNYLNNNFNGNKIAIITDFNLRDLYSDVLLKIIKKAGFDSKLIAIKPGEESKTMSCLQQVYTQLSSFKIGRGDLIFTLGGGVVGDLGGYAASTYLRGIPYIQIPTSLLAQVDSSIGGKVAVDLPEGKNLVGNFYHPNAVFIDPNILKTLDKRFLHDGLAEVIKYGCIKEKSILDKLLSYKNDTELLDNIEEIIYMCCKIKKSVVEIDEKDFGERMLLNFGHTLGHAIEKYYNYKKYTHGEAVGIGMLETTKKSEQLEITREETSSLIEKLLIKYNLPSQLPEMNTLDLLDTIALDKKNCGESINLILLKTLGSGFIKKIKLKDISLYI
jgi:3-dehydroquinate synthase